MAGKQELAREPKMVTTTAPGAGNVSETEAGNVARMAAREMMAAVMEDALNDGDGIRAASRKGQDAYDAFLAYALDRSALHL